MMVALIQTIATPLSCFSTSTSTSTISHASPFPLQHSILLSNTTKKRPPSFLPITTTQTTRTRRSLLCKAEAGSGKYVRQDYLVKKISAKEVEELVKGERSVPVIVDFYATWCGPCILMAQMLETLAVEYENNALFVKVDTDDEYEFARDMQVRGLPTLYFISPDPTKDAIRTEGLIPTQMIRDVIDNDM